MSWKTQYLTNLFVLAYVDEVYSAEEDCVIQAFIDRAEIPSHKVGEIRESAKTAAESLIDQIIRLDASTLAQEEQG